MPTAPGAVRREHEGLLVEWSRASHRLLRWVVLIEGLQLLIGLGLAGWLLILHASTTTDAAGLLLVGYWALSLPVLGEQLRGSYASTPCTATWSCDSLNRSAPGRPRRSRHPA